MSAFAYQGTNSHAILGSCPATERGEGRTFWQRRRFWFSPTCHPLLWRCSSAGPRAVFHFSCPLASLALGFLGDHTIHGRRIAPSSLLLESACAATAILGADASPDDGRPSRDASDRLVHSMTPVPPGLTAVVLLAPLALPPIGAAGARLLCAVDASTGAVAVGANGARPVLTARATLPRPSGHVASSLHGHRDPGSPVPDKATDGCTVLLRRTVPEPQAPAGMPHTPHSAVACIESAASPFLSGYPGLHPAAADAALHAAALVPASSAAHGKATTLALPHSIDHCHVSRHDAGATRESASCAHPLWTAAVRAWADAPTLHQRAASGCWGTPCVTLSGVHYSSTRAVPAWEEVGTLGEGVHDDHVAGMERAGVAVHGDMPSRPASTDEVVGQLLRMIRHLTGSEVGAGASLGETGLDSIAAVELRNEIAARFGLTLPATITFDYPTPDALAAYVVARMGGRDVGASGTDGAAFAASGREEILSRLLQLVEDVAGSALDADAALMESGIDSIGTPRHAVTMDDAGGVREASLDRTAWGELSVVVVTSHPPPDPRTHLFTRKLPLWCAQERWRFAMRCRRRLAWLCLRR